MIRSAPFDSLPGSKLADKFETLVALKSPSWPDAVHFRSALHTPYSLGKLVRSLSSSNPLKLFPSRATLREEVSSPLFSQQAAKPWLPRAERAAPASVCLTAGVEPLCGAGARLEQIQQHPLLSLRQWEGKSVLRIFLSWEYLKQNIPHTQEPCQSQAWFIVEMSKD